MKKLIFNIFILALSLLTCIAVSYSWFSVNKVATAKAIVISTGAEKCDFILQYYTGSTWENVNTDGIIVNQNLFPGNYIYFRLKTVYSSNQSTTYRSVFSGVGSDCDNEALTYDSTNNKILFENKIPLYDVVSNKVDVVDGSNTNTLYSVAYNSTTSKYDISLDYYKLEDKMSLYYISNNTNASYNVISSLDSGVLDSSITPVSIKAKSLFSFTYSEETTYYTYFALGLDESANKYYSFQLLEIKYMFIDLIE